MPAFPSGTSNCIWLRTFPTNKQRDLSSKQVFPVLDKYVMSTRQRNAGRTPQQKGKAPPTTNRTIVLQDDYKHTYTRPYPRERVFQKDGFKPGLTKSCTGELSSGALHKFRNKVVGELALTNRRERYGNQFGEKMKDSMLCTNAMDRIRTAVETGLLENTLSLTLRGFEGEPMTAEEFRHALKLHFGVGLSHSEVKVVMDHFDSNKDGLIDFNEVKTRMMRPHHVTDALADGCPKQLAKFQQILEELRALLPKQPDGEPVPLKALFEAADCNEDGRIDRQEFSQVIELLGLTKRDANTVFDKLDPNGDESVTFGEFAWVYYNRRRLFRSKVLTKEGGGGGGKGLAASGSPGGGRSRVLSGGKGTGGRFDMTRSKPQRAAGHREPWSPAGRTLAAKELVSANRQHAYTHCDFPGRDYASVRGAAGAGAVGVAGAAGAEGAAGAGGRPGPPGGARGSPSSKMAWGVGV
jgi:Ca2+-binding EF-hand superfamily protein